MDVSLDGFCFQKKWYHGHVLLKEILLCGLFVKNILLKSAGVEAERGARSWDENCVPFPCLPQTSRRSTLGNTLRVRGASDAIGVPWLWFRHYL